MNSYMAVPEEPTILTSRCDDAAREKVTEFLHDMMSRGYINEVEHDRRVTAVLKAETEQTLEYLTMDLPSREKTRVRLHSLREKKPLTAVAHVALGTLGFIVAILPWTLGGHGIVYHTYGALSSIVGAGMFVSAVIWSCMVWD